MDKILKLTRAFNPDWANKLETETQGEIKAAVDSIVANRHLIAHGIWVGISYIRMKEYYERAIKLVALIEKTCGI